MTIPAEFPSLLEPLALDDFIARYWQIAPCHVSGNGARYGGIISFAALEDELMSANVAGHTFRLENRHSAPVSGGDAYVQYIHGDTIVFDHVEARLGKVNALCHDAEETFNAVVAATAYISPARSQAFGPHYHDYDSFVLQIDGEKQWDVWPAHSRAPLSGGEVAGLDALRDPALSVRMRPGDLLYVPRGYPHCAFTAKLPALHLSIEVRPFTVLDLIIAGLRAAACREESLRAALPFGFMRPSSESVEYGQMLVDEWNHAPPRIRAEEARDVLTSEFWRRQSPFLCGRFASLHAVEQISDATLLERLPGRLFLVTEAGDKVNLRFGDTNVTVPRSAARALRFVADRRRFHVADIPGLTSTSQLLLARRLVEVGLLSVAALDKAPQPNV